MVDPILAAGPAAFDWGGWVGVAAVVLASINAFGGFLVTQRMLEMFKRKEPATKPAAKR
jgi:NAD(P) transhydrogenase subunit alpha